MFYNNFIEDKDYKNIEDCVNTFKNLNTEKDNALLSINDSSMCYNFNLSNGILSVGLGLNDPVFKYNLQMYRMYKSINFEPNYHIKGCWYFPFWDVTHKEYAPIILTYCANKKFYYNYIHHPSSDMNEIINLTFQEVPLVINCKINDKDTMVFVSKSDGMYTWSPVDGVTKINNPPQITSMCIQYGRMFVTTNGEKRSILYSDNLNPTNFNTINGEGGIIEINDEFGQSNKVISFKNYVYVFRDYNIARINSYGDDEYFGVTQMYVSNGKIHSGTICACGDKIVYLASDGLHEFDGNKSTKIDLNIDNLFANIDNDLAAAGYSNGYYYLACRMNFNDGIIERDECKNFANNAVIKYNVESKEFTILRDYDIRQITVVPDNIDTYSSNIC